MAEHKSTGNLDNVVRNVINGVADVIREIEGNANAEANVKVTVEPNAKQAEAVGKIEGEAYSKGFNEAVSQNRNLDDSDNTPSTKGTKKRKASKTKQTISTEEQLFQDTDKLMVDIQQTRNSIKLRSSNLEKIFKSNNYKDTVNKSEKEIIDNIEQLEKWATPISNVHESIQNIIVKFNDLSASNPEKITDELTSLVKNTIEYYINMLNGFALNTVYINELSKNLKDVPKININTTLGKIRGYLYGNDGVESFINNNKYLASSINREKTYKESINKYYNNSEEYQKNKETANSYVQMTFQAMSEQDLDSVNKYSEKAKMLFTEMSKYLFEMLNYSVGILLNAKEIKIKKNGSLSIKEEDSENQGGIAKYYDTSSTGKSFNDRFGYGYKEATDTISKEIETTQKKQKQIEQKNETTEQEVQKTQQKISALSENFIKQQLENNNLLEYLTGLYKFINDANDQMTDVNADGQTVSKQAEAILIAMQYVEEIIKYINNLSNIEGESELKNKALEFRKQIDSDDDGTKKFKGGSFTSKNDQFKSSPYSRSNIYKAAKNNFAGEITNPILEQNQAFIDYNTKNLNYIIEQSKQAGSQIAKEVTDGLLEGATEQTKTDNVEKKATALSRLFNGETLNNAEVNNVRTSLRNKISPYNIDIDKINYEDYQSNLVDYYKVLKLTENSSSIRNNGIPDEIYIKTEDGIISKTIEGNTPTDKLQSFYSAIEGAVGSIATNISEQIASKQNVNINESQVAQAFAILEQQMSQTQNENERLQGEADRLQTENDELKKKIDNSNTPNKISKPIQDEINRIVTSSDSDEVKLKMLKNLVPSNSKEWSIIEPITSGLDAKIQAQINEQKKKELENAQKNADFEEQIVNEKEEEVNQQKEKTKNTKRQNRKKSEEISQLEGQISFDDTSSSVTTDNPNTTTNDVPDKVENTDIEANTVTVNATEGKIETSDNTNTSNDSGINNDKKVENKFDADDYDNTGIVGIERVVKDYYENEYNQFNATLDESKQKFLDVLSKHIEDRVQRDGYEVKRVGGSIRPDSYRKISVEGDSDKGIADTEIAEINKGSLTGYIEYEKKLFDSKLNKYVNQRFKQAFKVLDGSYDVESLEFIDDSETVKEIINDVVDGKDVSYILGQETFETSYSPVKDISKKIAEANQKLAQDYRNELLKLQQVKLRKINSDEKKGNLNNEINTLLADVDNQINKVTTEISQEIKNSIEEKISNLKNTIAITIDDQTAATSNLRSQQAIESVRNRQVSKYNTVENNVNSFGYLKDNKEIQELLKQAKDTININNDNNWNELSDTDKKYQMTTYLDLMDELTAKIQGVTKKTKLLNDQEKREQNIETEKERLKIYKDKLILLELINNETYKETELGKELFDIEEKLNSLTKTSDSTELGAVRAKFNNLKTKNSELVKQASKSGSLYNSAKDSQNELGGLITRAERYSDVQKYGGDTKSGQKLRSDFEQALVAIKNCQKETENLFKELEQLETSQGDKSPEYLNKLQEINSEYNKQALSIKNIKSIMSTWDKQDSLQREATAFYTQVQNYYKANSNIIFNKELNTSFKQLLDTLKAVNEGTQDLSEESLKNLKSQYTNLQQIATATNSTGRHFIGALKNTFSSVLRNNLSRFAVGSVANYARMMLNNVKDIDRAMTELKKVTDETDESYKKFLSGAGVRAEALGSSMTNLIESTANFAKLGYNLQDAAKLSENAIMYSNVGDLDIQTATSDLISVSKAFKMSADETQRIVDSFNEVGNKYAVSAQQLGAALNRSASTLVVGGNTLDESIAMITAMTEINSCLRIRKLIRFHLCDD